MRFRNQRPDEIDEPATGDIIYYVLKAVGSSALMYFGWWFASQSNEGLAQTILLVFGVAFLTDAAQESRIAAWIMAVAYLSLSAWLLVVVGPNLAIWILIALGIGPAVRDLVRIGVEKALPSEG